MAQAPLPSVSHVWPDLRRLMHASSHFACPKVLCSVTSSDFDGIFNHVQTAHRTRTRPFHCPFCLAHPAMSSAHNHLVRCPRASSDLDRARASQLLQLMPGGALDEIRVRRRALRASQTPMPQVPVPRPGGSAQRPALSSVTQLPLPLPLSHGLTAAHIGPHPHTLDLRPPPTPVTLARTRDQPSPNLGSLHLAPLAPGVENLASQRREERASRSPDHQASA